jgi:coenzyme F420 hydrogenase subunit beta
LEIDPKKLSIGFSVRELCTRCGTCRGVCPVNAIEKSSEYYPILIKEKCIECGLCAKTCPGLLVPYRELYKSTFHMDSSGVDYCGHMINAYAGFSTRQEVREGGSSGGVATELALFLMESGRIDGVVVTKIDKDDPTKTTSFIAKNPQQIIQAQQSKYAISSVNEVLEEILKSSGRYAVIGLPCQIHGLRKALLHKPSLKTRIPYLIGLFCITTLEPHVISELMQINGIRLTDVADVRFREGKWPGKICAVLKDGRVRNLHYDNFKDGAINYLVKLYSPHRCQLCIDGTAEFADIALADAWMKNPDKTFQYPSMSVIMTRTMVGQQLLDEAVAQKKITATVINRQDVFKTFYSLQKEKRNNALLRAERYRRAGKPAPDFQIGGFLWTSKEKTRERIASMILGVGQNRIIRIALLRVLLSRCGLPLIWLRKFKKKLN